MPETGAQIEWACWNCRAATRGGHFCAGCGKIQPLPAGTDYFAFFGLPQKLRAEPEALEQHFHRLSWKLHPDNFARAGEREREMSLERSSQLNDAYRTLRDPVARVEYLLGLAGVRKEGQSRQEAPPELLEEVFELNEWLDELRTARQGKEDGELAELKHRLATAQRSFESKLHDVDSELEAAFERWDAALDAHAGEVQRAQLMAKMNEILNRRSYIRNLVAGVQQELAEGM